MKTLLIVDDNQQNLYMLQVLLSANGFKVEQAANGAEALELARRTPPDMIISDILMPVMDGFALCRAWQEDEVLRNYTFHFLHCHLYGPQGRKFRPQPGGRAVHHKTGRTGHITGCNQGNHQQLQIPQAG